MSFVTRKMQINWSWEGTVANLTGYEVAICLAESHPDDSTVIFGRSGRNSTSHIFEAVTVEIGVQYKAWVRAVYGEKTSAWVSTGETFTPDETWADEVTASFVKEVGFSHVEGGEGAFLKGTHNNTKVENDMLTLVDGAQTGTWESQEFSLENVTDITSSDIRFQSERNDYFHDYFLPTTHDGEYGNETWAINDIDTGIYFQRGRHIFEADVFESGEKQDVYIELENEHATVDGKIVSEHNVFEIRNENKTSGDNRVAQSSSFETLRHNGEIYIFSGRSTSPTNGIPSNILVLTDEGDFVKTIASPRGTEYYICGKWNNKFYIHGGSDGQNILVEFNPETEEYSTTVTPGVAERTYYGCGGVIGDYLYNISGHRWTAPFAETSCYRMDLNTKTWERIADIPIGVRNPACWEHNGNIYVFGGEAASAKYINFMQVYNIAENSWKSFPMNLPQGNAFSFTKLNNSLLLIGGNTVGGKNNIYKINPDNFNIELLGSFASVNKSATVWDKNGKVFVKNGFGATYEDNLFTFVLPKEEKRLYALDVENAGRYNISVARTGQKESDFSNYKAKMKAEWVGAGSGAFQLNELSISSFEQKIANLVENIQSSTDGIFVKDNIVYNGGKYKTNQYDPDWNNTTFLLQPEDGELAIIDKSSTPSSEMTLGGFTIRGGNGQREIYAAQVGGYITHPYNERFDFGAGDFTIEGSFIYTPVSRLSTIIRISNGVAFVLRVNTNKSVHIYASSTGNTWDIASGLHLFYIPENKICEISIVRSGSEVKAYLDGVKTGPTINIGNKSLYRGANDVCHILSDPTTLNAIFLGSCRRFRVTKGVARYTSDYTPEKYTESGVVESNEIPIEMDKIHNAYISGVVNDVSKVKMFVKTTTNGVDWSEYREIQNKNANIWDDKNRVFLFPDTDEFVKWSFKNAKTNKLQDFFLEDSFTVETNIFGENNTWEGWKPAAQKGTIKDISKLSLNNIKNSKYKFRINLNRARFGGAQKAVYVASKIGNIKAFASEYGATNDSLWRSTNDYTKLNGGVIEASSRIIIGDNNIILDGKSEDGITNAIYIAPDGGPGGQTGFGGAVQDYCKLHSGNIEFYIAAEGMHHKYKALNKCIFGICNANEWVTIRSEEGPIFWKKKPIIMIYPNSTIIYDANNSSQSQMFQCYVESIEKVSENSMQWKFFPKMSLSLGGGNSGSNIGITVPANSTSAEIPITGNTKTIQCSVSAVGNKNIVRKSRPGAIVPAGSGCRSLGYEYMFEYTSSTTTPGMANISYNQNLSPGSAHTLTYCIQYKTQGSSVWKTAPSLNFTASENITAIRLVTGGVKNTTLNYICTHSQPDPSSYNDFIEWVSPGVRLEYVLGSFIEGTVSHSGSLNYIAIGE